MRNSGRSSSDQSRPSRVHQSVCRARADQRGDPTLRLTLEDYLQEAITAQLGPFVALGNPYDRLTPDGAMREYAPDDQWQTRFLELAQAPRASSCRSAGRRISSGS